MVGILDQALSERLQMELDLTLDKTKRLICQCKAVKAQEILKDNEKEEISLHAVDKYAPRRKLPAIPPQTKLPKHKPSVLQTCRRCGKGSRFRQEYPAKEAICFRCDRRGHFGNQCLSSTVVNTKGDLNELTIEITQTLIALTWIQSGVNKTGSGKWKSQSTTEQCLSQLIQVWKSPQYLNQLGSLWQ